MEPALRLRGVTKTFGAPRAVDGLDPDVPRGATCGVIGPSGAGKTTCIRLIRSCGAAAMKSGKAQKCRWLLPKRAESTSLVAAHRSRHRYCARHGDTLGHPR